MRGMRKAVFSLMLAAGIAHAQQPAPFPPGATAEQKKEIIRQRMMQQRAGSDYARVQAQIKEREEKIAKGWDPVLGWPPEEASEKAIAFIRGELKDPASLIVEAVGKPKVNYYARVGSADIIDRYWELDISYRAKNSYGGYVKGDETIRWVKGEIAGTVPSGQTRLDPRYIRRKGL